jgi:hypothetical protein
MIPSLALDIGGELGKGIGGLISGLPSTLLDVYRMRRDGTFFEQQEFVARIQEHTADLDHQRQVELEARLSANRSEEELRRQTFAARRDYLNSRLRVLERVELTRALQELRDSPFGDGAQAHDRVADLTRGGRRPALLIAPFLDDRRTTTDNSGNPFAFRFALRDGWKDAPWQEDMGLDAGLIDRPLIRTDFDLNVIRRALADLPVVLVHGWIQGGTRVGLELVAWNIVDDPQTPGRSSAIQLPFPPVKMERPGPADELEFEDQLGLVNAQLASTLSEWFHVAQGRRPDRHRDLPERFGPAVGAGSLVAVELAVERGRVTPLEAMTYQARVYADIGERRRLGETVDRALNRIGQGTRPDDIGHLRALREAVRADEEMSSRVAAVYTRACGSELHRTSYGW